MFFCLRLSVGTSLSLAKSLSLTFSWVSVALSGFSSTMNVSLMRLLHIIKMIYNVSTFYNTSERVASLLVKITNQVIRSCKSFITENGSLTIWNQDREEVEKKLTMCIKLNKQYREAYVLFLREDG